MPQSTQHVVHISTSITMGCEHCDFRINAEDFARSVNHYIEQHDYKLMHVGQETTNDRDGGSWHSIVAVLGR